MPRESRPSEVQVWFTSTEDLSAARVESARAVLSADERARADRLHLEGDRRDFTMAHFLLRHCLSKRVPLEPAAWTFERRPTGKPYLADGSGREFNLSHTRSLVACAISDWEVGIDVERSDALPGRHASVERSFAPAEIASLARSGGAENTSEFLELWTLKEAFLKAAGMGLDLPLDLFAFELSNAGSIAFEAPPGFHARQWHFALFEPLPQSWLAVAAKTEIPPRFVVRRFAAGVADQDPLPLIPLRTSRTVP